MTETDKTIGLPILYSLRNCPYAMRARIALFKAKQPVLLRDLVLSNKPKEMLLVSPKGTVPVLVIANGINASSNILEESLDIMLWALNESDPNNLLHVKDAMDEYSTLNDMLAFIHVFDTQFKTCLEAYKCAKRYKESNIVECREACEFYIQKLEKRLTQHTFLFSDHEGLADIALLPFLRQFARIERQWYLASPYPRVKSWLSYYLKSSMFTRVMAKYPLWLDSHEDILLGS